MDIIELKLLLKWDMKGQFHIKKYRQVKFHNIQDLVV